MLLTVLKKFGQIPCYAGSLHGRMSHRLGPLFGFERQKDKLHQDEENADHVVLFRVASFKTFFLALLICFLRKVDGIVD